MCPRSSKQLYSVFKPINDAGEQGIKLEDLLQAAQQASFDRFARDFTSVPSNSISAFLRKSIAGRELELFSGDRLRLTPRGVVSFNYVLRNDIQGLPDQTPETISQGKAEAKQRFGERMKLAVAG